MSRSLFRRVALLLAIAGMPAPLYASPAAAVASAAALSNIHIDNFGRVTDTYFRGGQPQGHDYADLAAAGIKTIINLTSEDAQANERAMTEAAGMRYVNIPMTTHVVPTAAQIKQFLAIVTDAAAQPVYVHCVGGRHRTGVMTAVYRMAADGWSAAQAVAEMKQYKFGLDFLHPEFKNFVMAYPAQLTHAAETPGR
jgi:uncharacterized protein (TIGR01244 family)